MAKGVEDTACYCHLVLVALNEVGDSPAHFRVDVASFHAFNARTQSDRPLTMVATSTHDTKRSEDVLCRLDLISEIPDVWAACVRRWRAINAGHRREYLPDAATEYLLYQTLVGAWPLSTDRAVAYMQEAAHEAKRETIWLQPNRAYDAAVRDFVTAVLPDVRFVADLDGFVATLVDCGRINSLGATLLKLTSPGDPGYLPGVRALGPQPRRPRQSPPRRLRPAPRAAR